MFYYDYSFIPPRPAPNIAEMPKNVQVNYCPPCSFFTPYFSVSIFSILLIKRMTFWTQVPKTEREYSWITSLCLPTTHVSALNSPHFLSHEESDLGQYPLCVSAVSVPNFHLLVLKCSEKEKTGKHSLINIQIVHLFIIRIRCHDQSVLYVREL